jgi:hypothetical protein
MIVIREVRRFFVIGAVVLGIAAGAVAPAAASVDRTSQYPAVLAPQPPKFDPGLQDPQWKTAVTASNFEDLTTRRPAPLSTTAYLLYDASNLYVAFRATQDGVPIHAEQSTNDIGFGEDDAVGVCVDTAGGSGKLVYCFETTPRGVRYEQAAESARFQPVWQARAAVDGSSWTAMLQIPLNTLRAQGGAKQTWRFNFLRIVAGTGEHYTWAYDGLMQDGQPPNWPTFTDARFWPSLTGLQIAVRAARPEPRAELYGLESAGRDRSVFQQTNNTFATQSVRNYGVDFVYPITSTLAAVGTLNPDFSNVEVDQQTIVPQEFQRNLTEYRPFFAQGGQYFTPELSVPAGNAIGESDQIFYSPSIGTFDRGFKLEGTYGLESIGALEVAGVADDGSALNDQAFSFEHVSTDRTLLYWTDGVLAHHDIGDDSTIDSGIGGRNLASGLVYGYNQAIEEMSLSTDPDTSFAYVRDGFIDVHKPNYEWMYGYQDISPGYGPIDGFTAIDDARGPLFFGDFTGSLPGMKSWTGFFGADRFLTRDGVVHEADFFGNEDIVTDSLIHANFSVQDSELDDPVLTNGLPQQFDQSTLTLGYRDGTPSPFDTFYSAGPFSTYYLQQFGISSTRQLNSRFNVQFAYDGTHERSPSLGVNGQLLRSIAIGESLGHDSDFTLALRSINGTGGFAQPGVNFAGGFHEKFKNDSELFVNYGTPAAQVTLDRFIMKYVLRFGGGAGT